MRKFTFTVSFNGFKNQDVYADSVSYEKDWIIFYSDGSETIRIGREVVLSVSTRRNQ